MKLIQQNGQPVYGRFKQAFNEINLEDYKNPFLSHPLKKKLRYKKFSFVSIQHDNLSIGFAIADLAFLGHGFYYCYDRKNNTYDDYHAVQALTFGTQVQEATQQSQFNCFQSKAIEIFSKQNKKTRQILIRRQQKILCEAEIEISQTQPLYLCSPTGVRGWTYTHKSMSLAIKGYVNFQKETSTFNTQSLASLDDSCGYLRPETEWFWLSCQAWVDGKKIGINLASGVNESVGNENCLWVDGQLYALDDVIFERINQTTWHIYTLNQHLDFTVHTTWRRYEHINAGILASQFSQWIAVINGVLKVSDQSLHFSAVNALLEEHYAKW